MSERPPAIRVWDLPVRAAHWLLVVLIPFSWWSVTNHHLGWHRLSGYTIITILVFRLGWGLVGSDTARFARFLKGPRAALAYLRGAAPAAAGHNPMGGWSIAVMLILLVVQVSLGLFAVDEDGFDPSPLARFVDFETGRKIAALHHLNFKILLGFIALHLAAIAFYAVRGSNLVGPMITGRARLAVPAPRLGPWWLALSLAALGALVAWTLSRGLRF